MTDELKPCPFCGGEAITLEDSEHSTAFTVQHFSKGCVIDDLWDWYPDEAQAITAWNTRASLPATNAQIKANPKVKALVAALEETQNDASFFQQSGISQTAMSAAFDRIHNRARAALAALEKNDD